MSRLNFRTIFVLAMALFIVSGAVAQETIIRPPASEKYVISAKAGGVNYTEGTVSIVRAQGKSGILLKGDMVEIGDRVSTAGSGRVEILLNPGSYIRMGGNSSFEFGTTDLEDLQIKLDSGSAIFEVFADNEFRVSVSTPKGKVALIETGVYQIDIYSDGQALLSVTKGKAEVGETNATKVKDGRTATVGTDTVAIGKFDKDKRGELAEWSRSRSQELARVTSSLRDRALNNALSNTFSRGLWGMYDSFGLWIFDARFGGYCFLPFGRGWYSPYGFSYGSWLYWNNWPPPTYYYPTPATQTKVSTRGPRVTTGASGSDDKISTRGGSRVTSEPPPFVKIGRGQDNGSGSPFKNSDYSSDKGFGRDSSPSYSPPSYSPPPPPPPPAPAKVSTRDNN